MAAIFVSIGVILLASVDIGYLFYQKRELQKVADLAALSGAQRLSGATCDAAFAAASANARQSNNFSGTPQIGCGRWDKNYAASDAYYLAYPAGTAPGGQPNPNAVRVTVAENVISFLGLADRNISAEAIALRGEPIAAFSVGSKLLQVGSDGVVPGLLSRLGVNIAGSDVLSYKGLANVAVTPGGLLQALGFPIALNADVGTIREVLALGTPTGCGANACPLGLLLGELSTVGGTSDLVNLLGLQVGSLDLPVKLLSDDSGRGLFTLVDIANGQSALDVKVNALDLLTTAIGVANGHRAVDAGLNLPGVTAKIGIVEPPSIAIGGVGATAYTAQIRLYANIATGAIPVVGSIATGLLNTTANLPVAIDLVDGQGTLTNLCTAKDAAGKDTATIAVTSSILKACVGNIDEGSLFSGEKNCSDNLADKQLISLLNGLVKVNTHFSLDALNGGSSLTLSEGMSGTTGLSDLQIGSAVSDLMKALIGGVVGNVLAPAGSSTANTATNGNLAQALLSATGGNLSSAANVVNASANALRTFTNSLNANVQGLLAGVLSGSVQSLLNGTAALAFGLTNALQDILGGLLNALLYPCGLLGNAQACLADELNQSQTSGGNSLSNVLLTLSGLIVQLLQPVLNSVGSSLTSLLDGLLGIRLGLTDVTLLDLDCKGGGVKLVH
jgi:uncharacterized membrane protein